MGKDFIELISTGAAVFPLRKGYIWFAGHLSDTAGTPVYS